MNRLASSRAAKIAAIALATVLLLCMLGGAISTLVLMEQGFYDGDYSSFWEMPTVQALLRDRMELIAEEYRIHEDLEEYGMFRDSGNILLTITDPDGQVLYNAYPGCETAYAMSITAAAPEDAAYDEVTVTAYVRWPLVSSNFDSLFHRYNTFVYLRPHRVALPIVTGFAAVLLLACLAFLLRAAGHRAGEDAIVCSRFDRIPLEPIAVLWLGIFTSSIWLYDELYYMGRSNLVFQCIFWSCLFCIWFWLCLSLLLTVAARLKAHTFWQTLLVARLCRALWGFLRRAMGKVSGEQVRDTDKTALSDGKKGAKKAGGLLMRLVRAVLHGIGGLWSRFTELLRSLPGSWGLLLPAAVLLAAHLLGVEAMYYNFHLWCVFFVIDCLALLLIWRLGFSFNSLLEACRRLAAGDLTAKTDTSKLRWKFKTAAEALNTAGNGMAVAVEARMKSERMKTELITNVSHDIKTPLTSIVNYVDLLSKEPLPTDAAKEYVAVLERQSLRLKKLIEDLVEASKASTGNLTVDLEPMDLCEFLHQAAAEYAEALEQAQLTPMVRTPDSRIYALADGKHLWRILDNLLGNACKYSQPCTRLYLTLVADGDLVHMLVKNISREPLNIGTDELMERFVRGDSARSTEGSGLGLSIAQSLAELQGAKFTLSIDGDLFKAQITMKRLTAEQA